MSIECNSIFLIFCEGEIRMKKFNFNIPKLFLYLITNTAFLLVVANINTTCVGPGYQEALPSKLDGLKRFKVNE